MCIEDMSEKELWGWAYVCGSVPALHEIVKRNNARREKAKETNQEKEKEMPR